MTLSQYYAHLMAQGRVHVPTQDEARADFARFERGRRQGLLARPW